MMIKLLIPALLATAEAAFFAEPKFFGDWDLVEPVEPDAAVKFRVALASPNAGEVETALARVSSPLDARFRQYLSAEELTSLCDPGADALNRARTWLESGGASVVETHRLKDWLTVTAPASKVESLFQTTLSRFQNRKSGDLKVATSASYTVPNHVDDVITLVAGLTSFSSARAVALSPSASFQPAAGSGGAPASVTPDTIYDVYGVNSSHVAGGRLGSQGVVEFGQLANFNAGDLQTFFNDFAPALVGQTCGDKGNVDNNGDIRASVEANLDVQYIMATGVDVPAFTYKVVFSSNDIVDEFLEWAYLVGNETAPALVHSISYGEYGGSYDNATDHQLDYELQKMGLSGISVLLASGDNGVGCDASGSSQEFDFPDCPHVTMVGATYLDDSQNTEVGATLSSGGFSRNFMRTPWQATAVEAYLNQSEVPMPTEDFYPPGRAYPDVAAFGQNVRVVAAGSSESVSGTSCSAPIFAGVVASVNHELLSKGLAPLGFLNPWLYSNPDMFTDVTSGSNPYQKCEGFQASAGWDPVTGLGTPLYGAMLAYALATAPPSAL